ncbi:uncharacterized protein LOC114761928 [Neltuma alba]|uniref:uncharacterized protein LOC114719064 n=1 Tax=Neltuma alba TaxID=207710 RepID=UPI0010A574BE|nr:uncharacterized protein LOC114719064 [Prosopis alba]XP_028807210.1 uncharacterized protein LOC114761928 [Prosopis alba]
MFRSASSGRGAGKYEKLGEEASGSGDASVKGELKRSTTLASTRETGASLQRNPTKKKDSKEKSHPIFSFMDFGGKKKKTTARPEMVRYVEYLKEAGMWDLDSDEPVIYYK